MHKSRWWCGYFRYFTLFCSLVFSHLAPLSSRRMERWFMEKTMLIQDLRLKPKPEVTWVRSIKSPWNTHGPIMEYWLLQQLVLASQFKFAQFWFDRNNFQSKFQTILGAYFLGFAASIQIDQSATKCGYLVMLRLRHVTSRHVMHKRNENFNIDLKNLQIIFHYFLAVIPKIMLFYQIILLKSFNSRLKSVLIVCCRDLKFIRYFEAMLQGEFNLKFSFK